MSSTKKQLWMQNNADRVHNYRRDHCLKQSYARCSIPCRASRLKYKYTKDELQMLLSHILEQDELTRPTEKNIDSI
eukprot:6178754-Pleurochrysis_carterae.AAC.4